MTLNGKAYSYERNMQGDITGLLDSNNNEVVTYTYDSWGKLLNIGGSLAGTVGKQNPLRYRGYYYDTETGLFYVASRYYNPELDRFISKDDPIYEYGNYANLYMYCNGNPVNETDPTGCSSSTLQNRVSIKNSYTAPIQFTIKGNNVSMIVILRIHGSLADKYFPNTRIKYRQIIVSAIQSIWSGKYNNVFGYNISLSMTVFDENDGRTYFSRPHQKSIDINVIDKLGISNTAKPDHPFLFFHSYYWDKDNPSSVTLYKGDSRGGGTYTLCNFYSVVAHEFGHCMGVDDLYNKSSAIRNKYAPPNNPSIFNQEFGVKPSNVDIQKVLIAFQNNVWQSWT